MTSRRSTGTSGQARTAGRWRAAGLTAFVLHVVGASGVPRAGATEPSSEAPSSSPALEERPGGDLGVGLMADAEGAEDADETAPAAESEPSTWSSKGEVSLESRAFLPDDRASSRDINLGLFSRVGLKRDGSPFTLAARAFGRVDYADRGRSLVSLEELWAQLATEHLVLRAGVDIFNWSATEAFHPADIINARNFDSDIERYEKFGEPFASLELRWTGGSLAAYYLPFVGRPFLPSRESRLNGFPEGVVLRPFVSLDAEGRLTSSRFMAQGALRLLQTVGNADFSVHLVRHVDRAQPEFVFDAADGALTPVARTVTQLGGSYQRVLEPFILKSELAYRKFVTPRDGQGAATTLPERDHLQVAAGVEYSSSIGVAESTLILEGQSLLLVNAALRQQLHLFQRDVLIGYRLALNDTASTVLSASAILDVEDFDELLLNASATRRILDDWTIAAVLRAVVAPSGASAAVLPSDSDHVRLELTRYF